jgi:hypothetical protein
MYVVVKKECVAVPDTQRCRSRHSSKGVTVLNERDSRGGEESERNDGARERRRRVLSNSR